MAIRLVCLISLFLTHAFHGTLGLPLLLHQVCTRVNGCDQGLLERDYRLTDRRYGFASSTTLLRYGHERNDSKRFGRSL